MGRRDPQFAGGRRARLGRPSLTFYSWNVTREQFNTLRQLILEALLTADEVGAGNVAICLDAALVELTGEGVAPLDAAAAIKRAS